MNYAIRLHAVGCLLVLMPLMTVMPGRTEAAEAETLAATALRSGEVRGGLCVLIGCDNDELAAELAGGGPFVVQCLAADRKLVDRLRESIRSRGIYGRLSADRASPDRLPYADNLVNLLVADNLPALLRSGFSAREALRVLSPGGVAYLGESVPSPPAGAGWVAGFKDKLRAAGIENPQPIGAAGKWIKIVKPWPEEIDQWTHWLHGADGNAVARDSVVGPPRHLQWMAGPLWSRSHETVPSVSAMVSAKGRLFSIVDDAPPGIDGRLPDQWSLVARDAFNGIPLWKLSMPDWGWKQWSAKWFARFNQPTNLPRRLVAVGDRVYVTLGFQAPVTALDAASGKVLHTYAGTELTDEILYDDGLLILSVSKSAPEPAEEAAQRRGQPPRIMPPKKRIHVLEAETGETLWKQGDYAGLRSKTGSVEPFTHLTMAAGDGRVFCVETDSLHCLDLKTGKELWRAARPDAPEVTMRYNIRISDMCTLVYHDGILLFAQLEPVARIDWEAIPGTLHAFSAATGKPLWSRKCASWGWAAPADVFVIDGLVWIHEKKSYSAIALDPATGQEKRRFSTDKVFKIGHHHRCYRNKATERFMLASRRGVEFIDLEAEDNYLHHWARGACRFGIVPCNGLLYLTPHPCNCYIATKLNGFVALAGEDANDREPRQTAAAARFERGRAYAEVQNAPRETQNPDDWPTWRHDPQRSGSTRSTLPAELKPLWQADLGGRPAGCTVAGGKAFVSLADRHCVCAFDADTGKPAWSYTAGGRIDTPPTIDGALALFGSADGWVYCLRAADGALVWRFRAAPQDRRLGAFGQLESAWPVYGSVLLAGGKACCTAGRSSFLDGGIHAYALEPRTGKLLAQRTIYSPDPKTGRMIPGGNANSIAGALADVLVADGRSVFMRQLRIFPEAAQSGSSPPHLVATAGMLDDSWFNRVDWSLGKAARGQLLVFDDDSAYAVQAFPNLNRWNVFRPAEKGYRLFAVDRKPTGVKDPKGSGKSKKTQKSAPLRWSVQVPIRATAMLLAGKTLFVAGPPDTLDPDDPWAAFEGRKGGRLWVLSTADGKRLLQYALPGPPVANGMAAAAGRLLIAAQDGKLHCFAAAD